MVQNIYPQIPSLALLYLFYIAWNYSSHVLSSTGGQIASGGRRDRFQEREKENSVSPFLLCLPALTGYPLWL